MTKPLLKATEIPKGTATGFRQLTVSEKTFSAWISHAIS